MNIPVALANLDTAKGDASISKTFVAQLEAANSKTKIMDISEVSSADDIKTAIKNGDKSAGIIIGENFSSNLVAGKQGSITIMTDQSNAQMSQFTMMLTQMIGQIGTQTAMHSLNQTYKMPLNYTLSQIAPYSIQNAGIVPGQPNRFQYIAPGIIVMAVMMSLTMGPPQSISHEHEREVGTPRRHILAPVHGLSVIGGKVIAQTTRGMIQGLIVLALAVVLFDVAINGSITIVIGLILLSVFSFVGLSMLIISFMRTEGTANAIIRGLMFPMTFLSGAMFPLQQMPQFMQIIARFIPITYAVTALRQVMVLGAGVAEITTDIIILFGFGIGLFLIALVKFERRVPSK
jgi:ABC-2 type transport system permease protein